MKRDDLERALKIVRLDIDCLKDRHHDQALISILDSLASFIEILINKDGIEED